MIGVDTNILIYAHRTDSPWHEKAQERIRELAEGEGAWAIPWPSIHEFLAIVTHPRIFQPPTPLERALGQVDIWLESPSLQVLGEGNGYWEELKAALTEGKVAGGMVHDGRIAAICRQHGVRTLWSADRDLTRFGGLRVANPLL
jgi:hypothetical protein